MKILYEGKEITLINEPTYSPNSADNQKMYDLEININPKEPHPSSAHGLWVTGSPRSVILIGHGGATTVHQNSIIIEDDSCIVATGDSIYAIDLANLELQWAKKVDIATCFGVYWSSTIKGIISHGELSISALTLQGEQMWSVSGPEPFTGTFKLSNTYVHVEDFSQNVHKININQQA